MLAGAESATRLQGVLIVERGPTHLWKPLAHPPHEEFDGEEARPILPVALLHLEEVVVEGVSLKLKRE